jgi:hypothetical protein
MTTTQLRKQAKQQVDSLLPDKVRVAMEFFGYLETATSRDATAELLKAPGLLQDVEEADEYIKHDRAKNWRKVHP